MDYRQLIFHNRSESCHRRDYMRGRVTANCTIDFLAAVEPVNQSPGSLYSLKEVISTGTVIMARAEGSIS